MNVQPSTSYPDYLLLSPEQARETYDISIRESMFETLLHTQLVQRGIAELAIDLMPEDYKPIITAFETCLEDKEIKELWLPQTYYPVDAGRSSVAGYARKEVKIKDGLQVDDAKSLFHFNEEAEIKWRKEFKNAPREMLEFLDKGYALHHVLLKFARKCIEELEETHPNIVSMFFPKGRRSYSFMRLINYDAVLDRDSSRDIAKPHFDLGGPTIQAYADRDGFWGRAPGDESMDRGARIQYPTVPGFAHVFMGLGYNKIYDFGGKRSPIRPLYHGVEYSGSSSVFEESFTSESPEKPKSPSKLELPEASDETLGEARNAIILFLDIPMVNFGVTRNESLPQLYI